MEDHKKHIKALIGGLLVNNDCRIDHVVREITEAIIDSRKELLNECVKKIFQGEHDV